MFQEEVRQKSKGWKISKVKEWNYTAEELQGIADYLDCNLRDKDFVHTGGLANKYVYFTEKGKYFYDVTSYRKPGESKEKLYSRLVKGEEEKVLANGKPKLNSLGQPEIVVKAIGIPEDEIYCYLTATDIIQLINDWRDTGAAEQIWVDDPSDTRTMPDSFKKRQVQVWINKKGIDLTKWKLIPIKLKDDPEFVAEQVERIERRKAQHRENQDRREKIYRR